MFRYKVRAPDKENYKGLAMQFLEGKKGAPAVVLSKGLGIPGKEFQWMLPLNWLGFHVAYAPYRGTWGSAGKFLSDDSEALSVTKDISDVIDFTKDRFDPPAVYCIGDCFGASPTLVASAGHSEVEKIFTFGGMIYTSSRASNQVYRTARNPKGEKLDRTRELGETLEVAAREGGELFNGYEGFDFKVWLKMLQGDTGLNPYLHKSELARKDILMMHAMDDRLVHYERTADFSEALYAYCMKMELPIKIKEELLKSGGHRKSFGTKQELQVVQFLTGRSLFSLAVPLLRIKSTVKKHKRGFQRPDGSWFGVPFYDLVAAQVDEFQQAGLLKDMPIEDIVRQIF